MPAVRQPRFRLNPSAAAVALALAPFAAHAATITVTNTADSGVGSLRDAMTQANAGCLTDPAPTIAFEIPGTGPFVISPAFALPTLQCGNGPFSPTIDATGANGWAANSAAAGYNGTFGIVLDGTLMSSPGCGLHYNDPAFYGGTLTIRGVDVKSFTYGGAGQAGCGSLQAFCNRITASTPAVGAAT